jgi:hypothetical protein
MMNLMNIAKVPHVTGKFAGMRKPQEFLPHRSSSGTVLVQSDKTIGTIDLATGAGTFSKRGPYFVHLAMGEPLQYPPEFVEAVKKAMGVYDTLTVEGAPQ